MTEPSLEFIAAQLARVLDEQRELRQQVVAVLDELRVQGAITLRLDHSHASVLDELRALHASVRGLRDAVRRVTP